MLTVATTLDHPPSRILQILVRPLLPQHRNKCSQQRDQESRVHETGDSDNIAQWAFLDRWNSRGLTGDGRLIESEEDGAEKNHRLIIQIRLEVGMDIDDESGADGRE